MDDLIQKLMISKKIMDKTEGIGRGSAGQSQMNNFNVPNARYNIPQEFIQENSNTPQYYTSEPRENTKPVGSPSVEAIKKSKLPDEIKKLMMEHPISQPAQQQVSISNELVEKASRLMKSSDNNYIPESAKQKTQTKANSGLDLNMIQKMIEEAVEKTLQKHGVIAESTEKTNEVFSFKVGKHIFEGRVTKIKKLQ